MKTDKNVCSSHDNRYIKQFIENIFKYSKLIFGKEVSKSNEKTEI